MSRERELSRAFDIRFHYRPGDSAFQISSDILHVSDQAGLRPIDVSFQAATVIEDGLSKTDLSAVSDHLRRLATECALLKIKPAGHVELEDIAPHIQASAEDVLALLSERYAAYWREIPVSIPVFAYEI